MDESAEIDSQKQTEKTEQFHNKMEIVDAPHPEKETLEDAEKFGKFYESLLAEALGNGQADTGALEGGNETTRALADSIILTVREYRHKEHLLASVKNMQAVDFMKQAFSEEKLEGAEIELQELSEGIFAIFVDTDSFSKIYNNDSQAVAVKIPDGVSFVMIRKYDEESKAIKSEREENIPHEVNHLVWNYLKRDGLVQSDEENPEMSKAFQMYQDELAAKLISDGVLISYTHLRIMSSEARTKLQETNPQVVKQIEANQIELNDILEQITARGGSSGEKKKSYLLSLIRSRNFSDLKRKFSDIRDSLPQVEQSSPQAAASWDTV